LRPVGKQAATAGRAAILAVKRVPNPQMLPAIKVDYLLWLPCEEVDDCVPVSFVVKNPVVVRRELRNRFVVKTSQIFQLVRTDIFALCRHLRASRM
jgi:hypothetical protein